MKTLHMPQGSVEWHQARLGVITASEADALVSPTGKVRTGEGVKTYLYRKLAEKAVGYCPEMLETYAVDQGKLLETIALPWFEFETGKKVRRVGFVTTDDGTCGCSPDGLLEDGSGVEVKAPQPPNHIKYLLEGVVPDQYVVQCQFSLWVTQAPYWTLVSYSMRLPALVVRVERDEKIQAAITEAVSQFSTTLTACMAKIA